MQAQREADSESRDWVFTDPRASPPTLSHTPRHQPRSFAQIKLTHDTSARKTYEWTAAGDSNSYMAIVSRPYWLSFYAHDRSASPGSRSWPMKLPAPVRQNSAHHGHRFRDSLQLASSTKALFDAIAVMLCAHDRICWSSGSFSNASGSMYVACWRFQIPLAQLLHVLIQQSAPPHRCDHRLSRQQSTPTSICVCPSPVGRNPILGNRIVVLHRARDRGAPLANHRHLFNPCA